jgi:hypothetical protein
MFDKVVNLFSFFFPQLQRDYDKLYKKYQKLKVEYILSIVKFLCKYF